MKSFFVPGVSAGKGGMVSSEGVKLRIAEIISGENTLSPLSDMDIAGLLINLGIDISRRTVAKYRDEMNIPSSSRRKRF